jgi:hypothetical protein
LVRRGGVLAVIVLLALLLIAACSSATRSPARRLTHAGHVAVEHLG